MLVSLWSKVVYHFFTFQDKWISVVKQQLDAEMKKILPMNNFIYLFIYLFLLPTLSSVQDLLTKLFFCLFFFFLFCQNRITAIVQSFLFSRVAFGQNSLPVVEKWWLYGGFEWMYWWLVQENMTARRGSTVINEEM